MPKSVMTRAAQVLQEANLKATNNRLKVVACLFDARPFHTISDILRHTTGLNTKSVYNALKDLEVAKVVEVINDEKGPRYELSSLHAQHGEALHLTKNGVVVSHGTLDSEVYATIRQALAKQGLSVKSIKILVEIMTLPPKA